MPATMYCRDCHYPLKGLADPRCPECGRGFDPTKTQTFTTNLEWKTAKRWLFRIRIVFLPVIIGWMLYICSYSRTTGLGNNIGVDLLIGLLVAMTIGGGSLVCILWLGCRAKHYVLGVTFSIAIPVALVESLATYEEQWFLHQCQSNPSRLPNNNGMLFHNRWWPNGNSHLGYDPTTGQLYGTD